MTVQKPVSREMFDDVMVPNYAPSEIIPVRGEGAKLWDQNGDEYIDFAGGIAVNVLGHAHPVLVDTLKSQGEKLWHLSNVLTNEPAIRLAQRLTELTFAEKVFYANSGAEANEAALKLARRYAWEHFPADKNNGVEKNEIIAFNNSFHGRTLFTVSVGGQAKYREGFEPVPGGISHVDYNDLDALAAKISDKTCAVIMEPIEGEGGIVAATQTFIEGVRALCDKHNALLIFDEVQTGVGRTGAFYAYMNYGVTPDILTTAKALGGGFPIGAMLTTTDIAKSLVIGTHGSTYGGNPLACAVSEAVVNIVSDPAVLEGVKKKNQLFVDGLNAINEKYNILDEVRSAGLLVGAALNKQWQGKAKNFLVAAQNENLMVLVAGPSVVRFTPSLIITDEEIKEGLARFERAVATVVS